MEHNVALISDVISEHHVTRAHVRLAGDTISDEEAECLLREARKDWIPGRPEVSADRTTRLHQTLRFVAEGLSNHFATEEAFLFSLLGELLARALIRDHQRIIEALDEAHAVVDAMELEQLDREELLMHELRIRRSIDHICHLIDDHTRREDIVLDMMLKALQDD